MNRISIMLIAAAVLFSMTLISAEPQDTADPDKAAAMVKAADLDITVGKIRIPRNFVHAGKDYKKGIYFITLKNKGGAPHFFVHDKDKKLLFEELAILKPYKGKSKKFSFRVRKQMMKGYEYYRIKVIDPKNEMLAFFLIKKKEQPKEAKPEKKPEEKEIL